MRKRTRRYITIIAVLPTLLLAVLSLLWINRQSENEAKESLESYLDLTAAMGDEAEDPAAYLAASAPHFPDDMRVTLLDRQGVVLWDSQAEPASMPNHAHREEIAGALATGRGEAIRYSSTLGIQTVYVARTWRDGYVLRVAMPASAAMDFARSFAPMLLVGLLLVGLLVSVLVDRFAKRIALPYEKMLHYIEGTLKDDSQPLPDLSGQEEMEPIIG